VTWFNTIGMRRPTLNMATLRRGWEKLRHWEPGTDQAATRSGNAPAVLNPFMWPSFRGKLGRNINRTLIARAMRHGVPNLKACIGLTTIPIVADLVGSVPLKRWVYYCVDDFSQWPGLDSRTMDSMERQLVTSVDRIVVASDVLQSRIAEMGKPSTLMTHGVDLAYWDVEADTSACPPALADLPRPLMLFWGLIDRRLDLDFLKVLSSRLMTGSIVLVGPQQAADPQLASLPRLHRVGALRYEELPAAAAAANVLIMPYADLPVTRAMQPLKLKEYLATGKPVVARRLPAVESWSDALDAVDTADQFVTAVLQRLVGSLPHNQQLARNRLKTEDWNSKADVLRQVLFS